MLARDSGVHDLVIGAARAVKFQPAHQIQNLRAFP